MSVAYTIVKEEAPPPLYDLTVITVCYNALQGLKQTTDSVLAAKKRTAGVTIEHLVVDGGSADGTPEWLQQMKADGCIESYVSAPDRGIYDAMNKGINLARGKILFFLNAGDAFTEQPLQPCLAPILEGLTAHVAARARLTEEKTGRVVGISSYRPQVTYIVTPCCHQAYYATAELYRRSGGYAARDFRCCADGDSMAAHTSLCGEALAVEVETAHFAVGGFSQNTAERFLDEWLVFTWKHHDRALARAAANEETAQRLTSYLLYYALLLTDWQRRYHPIPQEVLQHYAEVCRAAAELPQQRAGIRRLLLYVAEQCVPQLLTSPALPLLQRFAVCYKVRFFRRRVLVPQESSFTSLLRVCEAEFRLNLGNLIRALKGRKR